MPVENLRLPKKSSETWGDGMNKRVDQVIAGMKDEIIEAVRGALKSRSVESEPVEGGPFGEGVKEALEYVVELGGKLGFETKNVEGYAGHVQFGESGDIFAILGHVDVVPEGSGWSIPPFEGGVKDGRIYGRGAVDNKGPVIAALYAMKAVRDAGVVPKNRVRLIVGTNEESGWKGISHYLRVEEMPESGVTPDAYFPMIFAEKGIVNYVISAPITGSALDESAIIRVKGGDAANMVPADAEAELALSQEEVKELVSSFSPANETTVSVENTESGTRVLFKGKSAHGSKPEKGVNAISTMVDFLCKIPSVKGECRVYLEAIRDKLGYEQEGLSLGVSGTDRLSGKLTVNLGKILLEPGSASVEINIRYPVMFNEPMIFTQVKESFGGFEVARKNHKEPLFVSPDSELVKLLQEVYQEMTGQRGDPIAIGGGTYARAIKNAVAFGPLLPGRPEVEHQPDEYIAIEDLMLLARIYAQLIFRVVS